MTTAHTATPIFTVMGFTVANAEQARTVLLVAKLQGRDHVVKQCLSIIDKYEATGGAQ